MLGQRLFTTIFPGSVVPTTNGLVALPPPSAVPDNVTSIAALNGSRGREAVKDSFVAESSASVAILPIQNSNAISLINEHFHLAREASASGRDRDAFREYNEVIAIMTSPGEGSTSEIYKCIPKGRKLMIEATISAARSALPLANYNKAGRFYKMAFDILRANKTTKQVPRWSQMTSGPQFLLESLAGCLFFGTSQDQDADSFKRVLNNFIDFKLDPQPSVSVISRLLMAFILKKEIEKADKANRRERERLQNEINGHLAIPFPIGSANHDLFLRISSFIISIEVATSRMLQAQKEHRWKERSQKMNEISFISRDLVSAISTLNTANPSDIDLIHNAVAGQLSDAALTFAKLKLYRAVLGEAELFSTHQKLRRTKEAIALFELPEMSFLAGSSHVLPRADDLREDALDHGRSPAVERIKAALAYERAGNRGIYVAVGAGSAAVSSALCMFNANPGLNDFLVLGASALGVFVTSALWRVAQGFASEESRSAGNIGLAGIPWTASLRGVGKLSLKSALTAFGSLAVILPIQHWQSIATFLKIQ